MNVVSELAGTITRGFSQNNVVGTRTLQPQWHSFMMTHNKREKLLWSELQYKDNLITIGNWFMCPFAKTFDDINCGQEGMYVKGHLLIVF